MDLLHDAKMTNAKHFSLPMEAHLKIDNIGPLFSYPHQYRRLIGKLIYLTITRLDLCYTIQLLSQLMPHPTEAHM